jgi:CDP-glycerol glycerophosphotransferase (TagB/SpsB family)
MQKFYRPTVRDNISVATMETEDVQDLLVRCKVLITDYSSVFYDAAYLDKTILFFQFDRDRFETEHYCQRQVDYDELGRVCTTKEEIMTALTSAIKGEGRDSNERRQLFRYHDKHNCCRVFQAVRELLP